MMTIGFIELLFSLGVTTRAWIWIILFVLGIGVLTYPETVPVPEAPKPQTPQEYKSPEIKPQNRGSLDLKMEAS